MIELKCPECRGTLTAAEEQAGTMVPCPHCGAEVAVLVREPEPGDGDTSVRCPFCAQEVTLRTGDEGMVLSCPGCGKMLRVERDPRMRWLILRPAPTGPKARVTPWQRLNVGVLRALTATLKQLARHPVVFYRHMPRRAAGGLAIAVYAKVVGLLALTLVCGVLSLGSMGLGFGILALPGLALRLIGTVLVGVILALIIVMLESFISHTILALAGQAREEFSVTCDVVGYANAMLLFSPIPYIGSSLARIGATILTAIGLREVHRAGTAWAITAAIATRILITGSILGLGFLLGGSEAVHDLVPWRPW